MGSKTPEGDEHKHDDGEQYTPSAAIHFGGEPRGSHNVRDGDGCLGEDAGGDDDTDDDGAEPDLARSLGQAGDAAAATASKKRKRPSKKKKKKKALPVQTSPPTVLMSDLFPSDDYPEGEMQLYAKSTAASAEEVRHDARMAEHEDGTFLRDYRKAAEIHRQTRRWVQDTVRPGQTLRSIAEGIEDSVRKLLGHDGLTPGDYLHGGLGFPTGLCLNHQVAHYTPNPGQKDVVLKHDDVMKVDFGVHVNGWIVDSAFTMGFDPAYDALLDAVRSSTDAAIRATGVDVRISDVSAVIQETMESYEVDIRGKTYPVKPVRNLCAHNIHRYSIHGDKAIPLVRNEDHTKMEDGEVFAIETFGTTGRGYTRDDTSMYGYKLADDVPAKINLPMASANRLHKTMRDYFGNMVFCRRYLDRLGQDRYLAGLKCLVESGVVEAYEEMAEIRGSYSAQFEHTILLGEMRKEVVSRGDDY